MSKLLKLSVTLPAKLNDQDVSEFEMIFSELLDSAAVSLFRKNSGDWIIDVLFHKQPDMSVINILFASLFEKHEINPSSFLFSSLPEIDWLAMNRGSFPSRSIGRFWIYGSHIKQTPPAGTMHLLVDASQAFGSGTHPTTEGCLRALQILSDAKPRRVLDVGCGSAILAMAAYRRWPLSRVVATDNDPVAIKVAKRNCRLNKIPMLKLSVALSVGFKSHQVRNSAPYDLIFANILAGKLIRMASDVCSYIDRRGWLILSGILNRQVVAVCHAYSARRFLCWRQIKIGDWTTLVMRPASCGATPYTWRDRCQGNQ